MHFYSKTKKDHREKLSLTRKSRWWGWRGGGRSPRERGASPSPSHLITPSNRSPITFPLSALRTDDRWNSRLRRWCSCERTGAVSGCKDESTANRREFTSTYSSVPNAPRGQRLARKLYALSPLPRNSLIVWSSKTRHCNVDHRIQKPLIPFETVIDSDHFWSHGTYFFRIDTEERWRTLMIITCGYTCKIVRP